MWRWLLVRIPLALVGLLVVLWILLPWPVLLRWRGVETTSLMRERIRSGDGDFRIRHEWVPLERISPNLRRAVVAAEDGRFYRHRGVDWRALAEELRYEGDDDFSPFDPADLRAVAGAVGYYRDHRGEVRGRSTITQQLAKNLYYDAERSLPRKVQEFFVAWRLEWFLDKERILEVYLNVVEWGPGIFGAEAAARHYFDLPASELTLGQAASLAATLPHPLTSNPRTNPGRMSHRRALILSWIRESRSAPEREVPDPPRIPRPEELGTIPPAGQEPEGPVGDSGEAEDPEPLPDPEPIPEPEADTADGAAENEEDPDEEGDRPPAGDTVSPSGGT